MAVLIDALYQFIQLHWFFPACALIVAIVITLVPHLLIHGPVARIARWWLRRGTDMTTQ